MLYLVFCLGLSLFLFLVGSLFKESKYEVWGDTPFECGFESFTIALPPFSLHFFSITIVFLIFDLEIIILFPLLITESLLFSFFLKAMIILILLVGLLIEWYDGSLDWELDPAKGPN